MWWQYKTSEQPLICVYCKVETSDKDDLEHILPESLGCKDTLYRGAVCKGCNHRLGINVDRKIFDEPLMASGQVATGTEGKKGARENIGKYVKKTDVGVSIEGANIGKPNEFQTSRAIAKCGVNIITHFFGSVITRGKYPELVQYVLEPKTGKDIWPYGAIFTPTGGFNISYGLETIKAGDEQHPIFVVVCQSGIFASVPDRNIPNGAEMAYKHIKEIVDKAIEESSQKIVRMDYVTQ